MMVLRIDGVFWFVRRGSYRYGGIVVFYTAGIVVLIVDAVLCRIGVGYGKGMHHSSGRVICFHVVEFRQSSVVVGGVIVSGSVAVSVTIVTETFAVSRRAE